MTFYIDQVKIQREVDFDAVKIGVFESIDSTNQYLKTIDNSQYEYHVCIAEHQSGGKGRLQRNWYSPYAKNIYLSITHSFKKKQSELSGLSMVMALSVLKTLLTLDVPQKFKVKWSNDVYFEDHKISGILIETIEKNDGECKAVIGIGLNVNMTELPQNILNNWTSLKKITSKDFDRNKICILLINNLMKNINEFETRGFRHFIPEWNKYDYLVGKNISIKSGRNTIQGSYKGIDETGHLLLETEMGKKAKKVITVSSGDASIMKTCLIPIIKNK